MKKSINTIAIILVLFFAACQSGDFQVSNTGLTYKIHNSNRGTKPSIDEIVKIDLAYRYPADSVFFHSGEYGSPVYVSIQPSVYSGDINEGLRMMAKGDSATFKLNANQFFTMILNAPSAPEFIKEGDSIYVDVLMHDIFTMEEFEAYQQKQREELMQEQETRAQQEDILLENYLTENNINTPAENSGLIIIVEEQGDGPKPETGQFVDVHYTGTLLDGTVFDSSVERGEPFRFNLGRGQVIRGWDEGVSKLNVGSKAKLIIPSHLAYGDQARGQHIKPYSTLIFEIELLGAE